MFRSLSNGVYQGKFKNCPSRSDEIFVTLVLTRSDYEEDECYLVTRHHEGTDVLCCSRTKLLSELKCQMEAQESPDWKEGLKSFTYGG